MSTEAHGPVLLGPCLTLDTQDDGNDLVESIALSIDSGLSMGNHKHGNPSVVFERVFFVDRAVQCLPTITPIDGDR